MTKYSEYVRNYLAKRNLPKKPKSKDEEASAGYQYENPKTGEMFTYTRKGVYKKDGVTLRYKGKATT